MKNFWSRLQKLRRDERGFGHHGNPEIMIVVAIIGILAAIAIPKFAELIRKSSEGASKGNLGATRSALSIFYGNMEGSYPYHPVSLTFSGRYMSEIPKAKAPNYHADSDKVRLGMDSRDADDTGGRLYIGDSNSKDFGTLFVNCTHTDSKGSLWTAY